jgi:hypothetical protein
MPPRGMKQRFRIAVGPRASFENEIAGRLKGRRSFEVRRHRPVVRIAGILFINYDRHLPYDIHHLAWLQMP